MERENEDIKTRIMELEQAATRVGNGFIAGKFGGKNNSEKRMP